MTDYVISSGQTSSGLVLHSGDFLTVSSGGVSSVTTVSSGGWETTYLGASVGDVVLSGGKMTVEGPTQSDTISSGGEALFADLIVSAGENLDLSSFTHTATKAETIESVTAEPGAYLGVYAMSVESGGTVSFGASYSLVSNLDIAAGGSAVALVTLNPDVIVSDFGVLAHASLGYGCPLTVGSGGISSDVTISNNTEVVSAFGKSFDDTVDIGVLTVDAGGLAQATTVLSDVAPVYGLSELQVNGVERGATVSSGGQESVNSGGMASDTTLVAGGTIAFDGGLVRGVVVSSGGLLQPTLSAISNDELELARVLDGGIVEFQLDLVGQTSAGERATKTRDQDHVLVSSGGVIGYAAPQIGLGGTLLLHVGGLASGALISPGGVVDGSGELIGVSIDSGGLVSRVEIGGGGYLTDASGDVMRVHVGGADGSGALGVYALASDTRVSSGTATVYNGGVMDESYVYSGGEIDLDGGVASGVTIHAGGALVGSYPTEADVLEGAVLDHGMLNSVTLASGAMMEVVSGGGGSLISAASGASIVISRGGALSDVATLSGASLVVDGELTYDVSSGFSGELSGDGSLVVIGRAAFTQSGDASGFSGRAVISGGSIELSTASDLGTASIAFEATGTATASLLFAAASQPAGGVTFGETLVDFDTTSEILDLTKINFISGATATLGGDTLTVVDGAYTAHFTLSGAMAAAYTVVSDGHGGALITAAASSPMAIMAADAAPAGFVQALAGFDPAGGQLGAPLSAHGLISPELVLSPTARGAG